MQGFHANLRKEITVTIGYLSSITGTDLRSDKNASLSEEHFSLVKYLVANYKFIFLVKTSFLLMVIILTVYSAF